MSELYDNMEIGEHMYIIIDKMSPFSPEMFSKKKTKRDNFSLRDFEICDIKGILEGIEKL